MNKAILIFVLLLLSGCVPHGGRPIVYEPEKIDSVFPFYVDGNPVSAVVTDNSIFQSSLDHTFLANRNHMRLWISYTNFSKIPVLFDPMESFTLTQKYLKTDEEIIHKPVFPSTIQNLVSKQKQATMIANAFIGIAEAASTAPTTFYSSTGVRVIANDLNEKLDTVDKNNADRAKNIVDTYDYYMKSINSILIKKNTVFPSQSVSGFVYFEVNGLRNGQYFSRDYNYTLQSKFSDIDLPIQFNPVEGY